MQDVIQLLLEHGYVVLFVWVLLEQAGLPIPAAPMLLAAGALAALGWLSLPVAIFVAVLGALPSDLAWYYLGRHRGTAALNVVCRIALEPDSCVRRTQDVFARHGLRSLLFVKFVPGLNAVAAPLAGAFRTRLRSFLAWDVAGALLWASVLVGLGHLLSDQIERFAQAVADLGIWAAVLFGGTVALYIAGKYLERRRFVRQLRIDRVTPDELRRKLEANENLVVIDLRSAIEIEIDPVTIPGALHMLPEELQQRHPEIPRDREVVLYCT